MNENHLSRLFNQVSQEDLSALLKYLEDHETLHIMLMHKYFDLPYSTMIHKPEVGDLIGRYEFLLEEVREFHEALIADDFPKMIDALVDIVVVAKGTAVMMGLPWGKHWHEVLRANLDKVRSKENRYDTVPELSKPPGWEPPDHQEVLDSIK
jgi:hypothetical protein